MLAFDDEMFKTEFFLSETNCSSTSFDLGTSPNPEAVMDQWTDLLFDGRMDLIGSHLQNDAGSDDVVQDDSDGELADLLTSDDPHRTVSRDNDGDELNAESAVTGNVVTEEFIPVFTADRSNRRDHDYNVSASDNEEDDDDDDDNGDNSDNDDSDGVSVKNNDYQIDSDFVPQTRSGVKRQAATKSPASKTGSSVTPTSGKRTGLRNQPTRKRCFSTSSITSQDLISSRPSASKKRKPSGDSAVFRSGADKCMTRNAIAARENREKKKAIMRQLEDQVEQQQDQIDRLMAEKEVRDKAMAALAEEVTYLRGVLKNESEIAAVINSIRKAPGITDVRTSFGLNLRSIPRPKKIQDENETPVTAASGKSRLKNPAAASAVKSAGAGKRGVCVHVNNGTVSLEFCAHCSQTSARTASK